MLLVAFADAVARTRTLATALKAATATMTAVAIVATVIAATILRNHPKAALVTLKVDQGMALRLFQSLEVIQSPTIAFLTSLGARILLIAATTQKMSQFFGKARKAAKAAFRKSAIVTTVAVAALSHHHHHQSHHHHRRLHLKATRLLLFPQRANRTIAQPTNHSHPIVLHTMADSIGHQAVTALGLGRGRVVHKLWSTCYKQLVIAIKKTSCVIILTEVLILSML